MPYTYKTQIVQPANTNTKRTYSISHQFDTPSDQIVTKRGVLFASLSVSTVVDFELESIAKLFLEHIQKTYYEYTDKTPLQALEASVQESISIIKNAKSKNEKTTFSDASAESELSLAICLIWNHILYIANIGQNANYVIRGSGSRDLLEDNNDTNEMKIASILLFDDDVIIVGTEKFAEIFPAREILEHISIISSLIGDDPKYDKLSVLIIKTNAETEISKPKTQNKLAALGAIPSFFKKIAFWQHKTSGLAETFKPYQNKKSAPISSINELNKNFINKEISTQTQTRRRIKMNNRLDNTKTIIGVAIFLLITSLIVSTYLSYNQEEAINLNTNEDVLIPIDTLQTAKQDTLTTDESTSAPLKATIQTTIDFNYQPTKIELYKENFVIYVAEKKAIYFVDTKTKKSNAIVSDVNNFEQLKCFDKFCILAFNKLSYIFDPNLPTKIDKYSLNLNQEIIDIAIYTDRVYYLTPEMIYWVKIGDKESTVNTWLKNNIKLENALSFSIDTDIFVLESNKVRRFASGVEQKYELKGQNFQNAIFIYASKNELYLTDILNHQIYKFDEAKEIFTTKYSMSDYAQIINLDNLPYLKFELNKNPKAYFVNQKTIYFAELTKQ